MCLYQSTRFNHKFWKTRLITMRSQPIVLRLFCSVVVVGGGGVVVVFVVVVVLNFDVVVRLI